jgi:hypothetical protein
MLLFKVHDIIPRVTIKGLFESLLIQCMANQTNSSEKHSNNQNLNWTFPKYFLMLPCQYKQAVEVSNFNDVLDFFLRESSTTVHKIQEKSGNTSVHVQDQICSYKSDKKE